MTSIPQSMPPDPDLVLYGVELLRRRIQRLMGDLWDSFSLELDRKYALATRASGEKREELVGDLLRFGLESPAAEVFETIVAHATTTAAMEELTRLEEESSDLLESFESLPEDEGQDVLYMDVYDEPRRSARPSERRGQRAKPPSEEGAAGSEIDEGGAAAESEVYEETEVEQDIEPEPGVEEGAAEPYAERDALELPRDVAYRGTLGSELRSANGGGGGRSRPKRAARPRAKGGARPKAKAAPGPKAKRAGRTKAKRAGPTKAKRPARPKGTRVTRFRTAPRPSAVVRRAATTRPNPRYVNLNFTDQSGRVIAKQTPLVTKRSYKLRVDIGDLTKQSVVKNAARNPLRADLLPASDAGHWLQLAAVSAQFKISPLGRWLFLPNDGPAWACRCKPGGGHQCRPRDRRKHVEFPVRAPSAPSRATLRLSVYFQKSVLQSLLVTATIAHAAGARGSNAAVVDYNLTNSLTDLELVRPRALSVVMNDGDNGTHTMVFNGAPDEVVALNLSDGQMTDAVKAMRAVMRSIHIEDTGPNDADKINRFDDMNGKSREQFIADLKTLAKQGYELWQAIWGDKIDLWMDNRDAFVGNSDIIQIARKQRSTSVFPWAMVYGIPIDIGAPENNYLCPLLEENEWKQFQKTVGDVPSRCPFEATHRTNVICPYGLWGIRYEIEQPPSLQKGRSLWRKIPIDPPPLNLVVALSDDLDPGLASTHLRALHAQHRAFTIRECRDRNEIRDGLGILDIEVVYFYSHGYSDPLPGNAGSTPRLGVGRRQLIAPPDLTTWLMQDWKRKEHWKTTAPLVFINGCHTADTTPQSLVNFVDTFSASLNAAGVIGTEITLHQLVANEVGQTFLNTFQRGVTVGRALRQARGELLRKGNLLGLVYTAYCSADLQLSAGVA